ncbi:glycosyltransferase [Hydrogenophaga sp.]|uniref:glycosyltransferase n=1 Tax=Hydrogenophaga sp. TaxID=1904254 RepID=UPI00262F03D1|nr:glycosyltransferase [Hydrogenophaga sp.]MDM7950728.1 glycosyltransferase [Hydrogenophaga sp.]
MLKSSRPQPTLLPVVDIVVIGRNEGKRLDATFGSIETAARRLIYVDSGSTDDSVAIAKRYNAIVVNLDVNIPFTAARARNAGLAEITRHPLPPAYVQFMDGDCSLSSEWLKRGIDHLARFPAIGAVCGRRREIHPDASIYNRMCDWEWNTPLGPTHACGGDMLVRYSAITSVGGYREDVIAAEDNEVCQRLIAKGWGLYRLDADMTHHDADMNSFSQWWKRAVRAGHGFAQVGDLHPGYFRTERRRVWFWSTWVPLTGPILSLIWTPLMLTAPLLYLASFLKCLRSFRRGDFSWSHAIKLSALLVISKFPNLQGILTWRRTRAKHLTPTIIEYK